MINHNLKIICQNLNRTDPLLNNKKSTGQIPNTFSQGVPLFQKRESSYNGTGQILEGNNLNFGFTTGYDMVKPYNEINQNSKSNMQNKTFNSKQYQLSRSAIGPKMSGKSPNNQFYQSDIDRNRRQIMTQIIQNQNEDYQVAGQSQFLNNQGIQQHNVSIINNKKLFKELIYGPSPQKRQNNFDVIQKEDLQQQSRSLKMQVNATKDENIRLKTQSKSLQVELLKKDRVIENLTQSLQKQLINKGVDVHDQNVSESFLISQIKKQNRELRIEVGQKDATINKLRLDIKLSKAQELEIELQQYIEECARLRQMLEQSMIQRNNIHQVQAIQQVNENQAVENQARIEEAFYQKEVIIQQEFEMKVQLENQLLEEREQKEKLKTKLNDIDNKFKKFNEITADNKRKQKVIQEKTKECIKLKEDLDQASGKAKERDNFYNKNKELVTKNVQQTSSLESKDKKITELDNINKDLQDQLRQLEKKLNQSKQPTKQQSSPNRQITFNDVPVATAIIQAAIKPLYGQEMITLLFRLIKDQKVTTTDDSSALKVFYNNNKKTVDQEFTIIKLQALTKSENHKNLMKQLIPKASIIQKQNTFQSYQDLEKFVDIDLKVQDVTQKKFLIFYLVFKFSESLKKLSLSELQKEINEAVAQQDKLKLIPNLKTENIFTSNHNVQNNNIGEKKEQQIEQDNNNIEINTVRIDENIGETSAQFIPPQHLQEQKLAPNKEDKFDERKTSDKNQEEHQRQQNSDKHQIDKQNEDDYDEEKFEDASEYDIKPEKNKEKQEKKENKQPVLQDSASEVKQISEDEMLDIAEHVFQVVADKLKQLGKSVRGVFGKVCTILDEFEGEQNVEILTAQNFLECMKAIGLNTLTQLEIACLMRVLTKPEIQHSVVLNELQMVMENFGLIVDQQNEQPTTEDIKQKKQKISKQKKAKELIQNDPAVYQQLAQIFKSLNNNMDNFKAIIVQKAYVQTVRSKQKESKVELIQLADFLELIQTQTGVELQLSVIVQLSEVLQIDPKFSETFTVKSIYSIMNCVLDKINKEEADKKVLQEFYKLDQEKNQGKAAGEVLNFEQLMEDDEDAYYEDVGGDEGQGYLGSIKEDDLDEHCSPQQKIKS